MYADGFAFFSAAASMANCAQVAGGLRWYSANSLEF
jgi:hypothetical protein